jgi:peptidoglycan hydrolase-like protein with peptidoglycan-binding domain
MMTVREIQTRLRDHGFYHGPIDGKEIEAYTSAIIAFKVSKNLAPRDYIGPITEGELRKAPSLKPAPPKKANEPVWLRRARQELGQREIP